ncbi:hypothetical protein KAFR_0A06520 [Kazachstania africana CBS 2517]|uniref:Chromatin structure-remodeling complex subunit SFH1 n=1 Tax=Kazachstania africana (strain ATCC 22294 / BCRC 22015 / CBS 2517 / CECT 1963 / NBRC 1671 / NRRL Y-8276) TaxID=1071382 RepID=H2ANY7_KAZAF|nr:hypothetical protein KAFR_0A06520 [Kazachstania africana CBS 2517]CCF56087.1 hypothetical protein KAFR_0A06520 [Kazachstania africana CBS 2517]
MSPIQQTNQQLLLPQAYLTNFHNRIRNEDDDIPLVIMAQPARGHKRAKVVNYAEFDNDLLDDLMRNNDGEDNESNSENDSEDDSMGVDDNERSETNENDTNNNNEKDKFKLKDRNLLPDIYEQDDQLNILKYPKIRETFLQSKIAMPYRLNIEPSAENQQPIVIPIHLNLEFSGNIIDDYITWDINDNTITPDEFATIYCRDLNIPISNSDDSFHHQIINTINESITSYEKFAAVKLPDLHIIINLTCNLNDKFYEDNFQWNLSDDSFTPEIFAEIIVCDLGLTRDFLPILNYSLYDSLIKIKKDWIEGNLVGSSLDVNFLNNDAAFGYLSGIRLDIDELGISWCPKVESLTQQEIQKREIEKERNLRRLKRESDRLHRRGFGSGRKRFIDDLETTMRI